MKRYCPIQHAVVWLACAVFSTCSTAIGVDSSEVARPTNSNAAASRTNPDSAPPATIPPIAPGLPATDNSSAPSQPPAKQPAISQETDCWVETVESEGADGKDIAKPGDWIDVTVVNPGALWKSSENDKSPSASTDDALKELVLFIDEHEVLNSHPLTTSISPPLPQDNGRVDYVFKFRLDEPAGNNPWPAGVVPPKKAEEHLNEQVPVDISVGFSKGKPIRTKSRGSVMLVPQWIRPPDKTVTPYASNVDCWVNDGWPTDLPPGPSPDASQQRPSTLGSFNAKLGDDITLVVANPDAYVQWAQLKDPSNARSRALDKLVLFLNGHPIPGMTPLTSGRPQDGYFYNWDRSHHFVAPSYYLDFHLTRGKESNSAWAALLDRPTFDRPVTVSVGFPDLDPVSTIIQPALDSKDVEIGLKPMHLAVIPKDGWTIAAAILIFVSFIMFLWLSATTNLIREAASLPRPDGRKPFSLARTQMAFWFFIVFATYFFIFFVTGDTDTIPWSILGLIGVSAATAVGSALVDSASRQAENDIGMSAATVASAAPNPSEPVNRRDQIAALTERHKTLKAELAALKVESLRSAKQRELESVNRQSDYFKRGAFKNFWTDLVEENGSASFHRYQICVWTLALGIIFFKEAWENLAMPNFSATVIGLMGISSGTYVALKERPAGKP